MEGAIDSRSDGPSRWTLPRLSAGWIGAGLLLAIAVPCFVTLPWSLSGYTLMDRPFEQSPSWSDPMGTTPLGKSMLWQCLLGGAISLSIGIAAAVVSVAIGVSWGAIAGSTGGRTDAVMMRIVDVLYGLPYILLVVLLKVAVESVFNPTQLSATQAHMVNLGTLMIAIGGVSWLTMARVIRGQVLSLREQPFLEAARAMGTGRLQVLRWHLLPNLVGPIIVYTTLTVPVAILQESFLSFLGIGVQEPMPSWGRLVAVELDQLHNLGSGGAAFRWWLVVWPSVLLGLTLLALNFLGDALRERFDPKSVR